MASTFCAKFVCIKCSDRVGLVFGRVSILRKKLQFSNARCFLPPPADRYFGHASGVCVCIFRAFGSTPFVLVMFFQNFLRGFRFKPLAVVSIREMWNSCSKCDFRGSVKSVFGSGSHYDLFIFTSVCIFALNMSSSTCALMNVLSTSDRYIENIDISFSILMYRIVEQISNVSIYRDLFHHRCIFLLHY